MRERHRGSDSRDPHKLQTEFPGSDGANPDLKAPHPTVDGVKIRVSKIRLPRPSIEPKPDSQP